MNTVDRLTKMPRAYDPAAGVEMAALLPELPPELRELLAGGGGSSPYLRGLIVKHGPWLPEAFEDPEAAVQRVYAELQTVAPPQMGSALRAAKARIALITGLMDLGGIWTLEQVTETLTEFAALACDLALRASLAPLVARGKIPGLTEDDLAHAGGMVVLAMGKMGAHELNYSSDIDLICLFDQDRFDVDHFVDARSGFIKATRAMSKMLNDVTGEGYVFRTDLRLRPDPSVTPVCIAIEAAERYYESLGRTWERAAYIKARPVAGDIGAGERFLTTLSPFVWRKHLDFAAIEDAHNMRLAIRAHKGLGGDIEPLGHNIKLGRGGIREIEFFTQTRQLIAGGRDPSLRVRGTVPGLNLLAQAGWLDASTADSLSDHYRFHRTLEHRVQMVQDAQTHIVPKTEAEFERIACLMGQDAEALKNDIRDRLQSVETRIEGFFSPTDPTPATPDTLVYLNDTVVSRWLTYAAMRTDRAQTLLDRLRPVFEQRLTQATRPEEALTALDGFLAGLPAGVQLLSLFESNPQLIDLVLDIVTTAPALADHLSRNAHVLDAVIGGGFFTDWPAQAGLEQDLTARLSLVLNDYEGQLDSTRRWMKEWHFRIGVHVLRGLIDADTAGRQYADLARAVLAVLWPCVQAEFARKHGPAPGRGAVLLGMGALGAGRMNARSDLDLIVIYDPEDVDMSDGPRPLAARPYFARLTQALITGLSAPMAEGRLYEVDMRLRPSGNKGPVATSWTSFQSYQSEEAWTWEHLAMTRARVITGDASLSQDVGGFLEDLIAHPRNAAQIADDVQNMRLRIADAKTPSGAFDIKAGPGLMQDIELFAQTGALLQGQMGADMQPGLTALTPNADQLMQAHHLFWQVQTVGRLLTDTLGDSDTLATGARDFLLRMTQHTSLDDLQKTLEAAQKKAQQIITQTLQDIISGTSDD